MRLIYKSLLNNLTGRMALNENNLELKIVNNLKLENILQTEKTELLFKSDTHSLIKSYGYYDNDFIKLINKDNIFNTNLNNSEEFNKPWGKSLSAIQYAAALTAYARIYLHQFKNIKDNEYLGGDTDSIIMRKPIDNKFVGTELGKFKLEMIIQEAFFHSKKFYAIISIDSKQIIKAKGISDQKNVLNLDHFINLFKGKDVTINQLQMIRDNNTFKIKVKNIKKKI
jgi:hypothetical protein